MPTIGLIVEGAYDEAAIPVLVKRCRPNAKVIIRKCRGSVTGRLAGIVVELGRTRGIERIVVVSDADGEEPARLSSAIRHRIPDEYRTLVRPVVIAQMLEAWLIADPAALRSVTGRARSFAHPERIRDPKAELRRLFTRATAYTPEIARRLAEAVDLKLLERRCPSFVTFRDAVRV